MAEDAKQFILRQYDDKASLYEGLTSTVTTLVEKMLRKQSIRVHSVTSRVKTRESLQEKIARPDKSYSELRDVTDIAGIRIITYFDDDVDRVAKCIEKEFVIDWENSIDRRATLDPDRFGYLSLHYVAELSSDRTGLLEYKEFSGLKAEVQTRSILQHAWAEMEHDLGYKTRLGVPKDIRRRFSALAGMLEVADREFEGIRDELAEYEHDVQERIQEAPQSVEINKASLSAFTENSLLVNEIDKEIASVSDTPLYTDRNYLNDEHGVTEATAAELQFFQVKTIQDLETKLRGYRREIVALAEEWLRGDRGGFFTSGVSIIYLLYLLAGQTRDDKVVERFLRVSGVHKDADIKDMVGHILKTYESVRSQNS